METNKGIIRDCEYFKIESKIAGRCKLKKLKYKYCPYLRQISCYYYEKRINLKDVQTIDVVKASKETCRTYDRNAKR